MAWSSIIIKVAIIDPVITIDVVHPDPFDKLHKIKLNKDAKTPINKWSNPKNHVQTINTDIYNVGLPTGKINIILVCLTRS